MASSTPTASGSSNQQDSNPTSRPLLFFVALGFGVVFTNLWYVDAAPESETNSVDV